MYVATQWSNSPNLNPGLRHCILGLDTSLYFKTHDLHFTSDTVPGTIMVTEVVQDSSDNVFNFPLPFRFELFKLIRS